MIVSSKPHPISDDISSKLNSFYAHIQIRLKELFLSSLPSKFRSRIESIREGVLSEQPTRETLSKKYSELFSLFNGEKSPIMLRLVHLTSLLRKVEHFHEMFSIHPNDSNTFPVRVMIEYFDLVTSLFNTSSLPLEHYCYLEDILLYVECLTLWAEMFQNYCLNTLRQEINDNYLAYGACVFSIHQMNKYFPSAFPSIVRNYFQNHSSNQQFIVHQALEQMKSLVENASSVWQEQEFCIYSLIDQQLLQSLLLRPLSQHPSSAFQQHVTAINSFISHHYEHMQSEQDIIHNQNYKIKIDLERLLFDAWKSEGIVPKVTFFGSRISGLSTSASDLDISLALYRLQQPSETNPPPTTNQQLLYIPHPFKGTRQMLAVTPITIINDRIKNHKQIFPPGFNPQLVETTTMDILYVSNILRFIKKVIHQDSYHLFQYSNLILGARTPILTLRHRSSHIEIDICCEHLFGIQNTLLIQNYCQSDPRIHQLLLLLKLWLKSRRINQAANGLISSHSWCLLLLYFLQRFQWYCLKYSQEQFNHQGEGQKIRSIIVPEYHWTETGREMLRISRQGTPMDLTHALHQLHHQTSSARNPSASATLFELIRPAAAKDYLEDTMTVGELFVYFFMFYGHDYRSAKDIVSEGKGLFYDFQEDNICLCDETSHLLESFKSTTVNISNSSDNSSKESWRMTIMDPFENMELGKVIHTSYHQFTIQNELLRGLLALYSFHPCFPTTLATDRTSSTSPRSLLDYLLLPQELLSGDTFLFCMECKRIGHIISNCPYPLCGECGRIGHKGSHCPLRVTNTTTTATTTTSTNITSVKQSDTKTQPTRPDGKPVATSRVVEAKNTSKKRRNSRSNSSLPHPTNNDRQQQDPKRSKMEVRGPKIMKRQVESSSPSSTGASSLSSRPFRHFKKSKRKK